MMQAAEARSKKQSLMPSGPRKVGGDLSMLKGLTPAQVPTSVASCVQSKLGGSFVHGLYLLLIH